MNRDQRPPTNAANQPPRSQPNAAPGQGQGQGQFRPNPAYNMPSQQQPSGASFRPQPSGTAYQPQPQSASPSFQQQPGTFYVPQPQPQMQPQSRQQQPQSYQQQPQPQPQTQLLGQQHQVPGTPLNPQAIGTAEQAAQPMHQPGPTPQEVAQQPFGAGMPQMQPSMNTMGSMNAMRMTEPNRANIDEFGRDIRNARMGTIRFATGSALGVVGLVFLMHGLADYLSRRSRMPVWRSEAMVGTALTGLALVLGTSGRREINQEVFGSRMSSRRMMHAADGSTSAQHTGTMTTSTQANPFTSPGTWFFRAEGEPGMPLHPPQNQPTYHPQGL